MPDDERPHEEAFPEIPKDEFEHPPLPPIEEPGEKGEDQKEEQKEEEQLPLPKPLEEQPTQAEPRTVSVEEQQAMWAGMRRGPYRPPKTRTYRFTGEESSIEREEPEQDDGGMGEEPPIPSQEPGEDKEDEERKEIEEKLEQLKIKLDEVLELVKEIHEREDAPAVFG